MSSLWSREESRKKPEELLIKVSENLLYADVLFFQMAVSCAIQIASALQAPTSRKVIEVQDFDAVANDSRLMIQQRRY